MEYGKHAVFEGNLVIRTHCNEFGQIQVGIYGDPKGLKEFGEFLIQLADFDQTALPPRNLPEGEGIHIHLKSGLTMNKESCPVTVGRLDGKGSGSFEWFYPKFTPKALLKNKRSVTKK
jgi:hypothetical protein